MVQLQKDLDSIQSKGVSVVAVSYDSVAVLKDFAEANKISFPLLSDEDSKTIDAFGVRNEKAKGGQDGIPHPITFLIGKDARVKAKLPGTVFKRHTTEALLKAIQ